MRICSFNRDSRWALLVAGLAVILCTPSLRAAQPSAPVELDDRAEPFVPLHKPSEHDLNHRESLVLFATGRTEEQRGNLPAALRFYQRALRLDPQALPVVRQIIEVSRNLDRVSETLRYALLAVELDPSDQRLVVGLASQLSEDGNFAEALKLYQKARSLPSVNKKSADYIVMSMQVGRLCYLTDRTKEASDAFAEVMSALDAPKDYGLDPARRKALAGKDGKVFLLFGDTFLSADRPDLADKAFEKANEIAPDKNTFAYHQARVLAQRKQFDAALDKLQAYFDAHAAGEDEAPYELLKKILDDSKRGELVTRLEKLREGDPDNVPLKSYLASQYLADKQVAQAESLYTDLVKRLPQVEDYRAGLADTYLAAKNAEALLKLLSETVDRSGSLASLVSQIKALIEDQALLDQVLAAARTKQSQPNGLGFGGSLAMAQVLMEAKRYEPAGEFFDAVLKTKPKNAAEITLAWGQGLLLAEQYQGAIQVFERGVADKLLPRSNPTYHNYLAIALEYGGQTDAALTAARKAIELGEKSARLESRVAWIYYHAKRYAEAEKHFRQLLERHDSDFKSDDTRRVMREARLTLSNIAVVQHAMPQAEEWLEQVLDEFPEDVSAMNDLGYIWADQGKHLQRALQMIQDAVAADPANGAYRDSLGWAFYRLGRYDEALVEMEKAAAEPEPDGVILDHLGDVLQALKKTDRARDAWKRAVESLKKQDDKDKVREIEDKLKKHAAS